MFFLFSKTKQFSSNLMGETVGNLIGLNDEVIHPAATLALEAHNSPSKQFLVKKIKVRHDLSSVVVLAFSGSMLPKDWFGQPTFAKTEIDTGEFRSLTSLKDGGDAVVNGSFLRRFNDVIGKLSHAKEVFEFQFRTYIYIYNTLVKLKC